MLAGRASAKQAVHGDLMPANLSLAEAELTLAGKMGRELTLRKALKKVEDPYDVVMIDCPPALGLLTVNALVAADHALLSSEAQYFALQGVEQALEVIELARDGLNPDLDWLGVFFNIADMRTVHSREAFDSLREHVGDKLFTQTIRPSIAYAGSAERAVSILQYRPDLAEDYLRLGDELLGRLGLKAARKALKPHLPAAAPRHRLERPSIQASHANNSLERRTRPPVASKGTRVTSAQPSASVRSASTSAPVCS